MSEHTPGPWRVNKVDQYIVEDKRGRAVAGTAANFPGKRECHANARLIAAAPALLEAVRAWLAAETLPEYETAERMARAALAAVGEG